MTPHDTYLHFRALTHAIVRAQHADDVQALTDAITPFGLTVANADELIASKIVAHAALVALQREAVRAIGDEVQP